MGSSLGPQNPSNKLLKYCRNLAFIAFLALACCAGGMSGGGGVGKEGGLGNVGAENNATGFGVGDVGDDNPAWSNSDGSFAGAQPGGGVQRSYATQNGAGFPDPEKALSGE